MARPRKEGQYVTYKFSKEIINLLNAYSEKTMIPKTKIVEAAIKAYINEKEKKQES